jgi:glutathione synthase/RimK-type ligase-like ATP-grasp enzyme
LVVAFHRNSVAPFEIAEAASELCELIWVLDHSDPTFAPLLPLIRRLGITVDSSGLSDAEVAARVRLCHPDGVITFASEQLPLGAAIAEESGLRFHSRRTADLLTNKYRQRAALAEARVPGPGFWPIPAGIDPAVRANLVSALSYPVVLKPKDGSGSQNIHYVADAGALGVLLAEAQGAGDDMLVEELLAEAHPRDSQRFADVLSVDSLVWQGCVTHYAVAGHFIRAPQFRGTGSFIPSHFAAAQIRAVLEATEVALKALDVETGFTNTDLILTPDGPRVIEVNGRIGGQIPTLLSLAGTPSLLFEAIRFSLGESDGDLTRFRIENVPFCAMYQPPMEARRLVELTGLEIVGELQGVTGVVPDRRVGDSLDWRRGTLTRLLTVYGVARDHDHLYELHQQIQRSIVARYEMAEALPPLG